MGFIADRMAMDRAKTNFVEMPPFPYKIIIETINMCNLRCVFCNVPKLTEKVYAMDLELAQRVIHDSYAAGAREIGFIGNGDSFLHPDFDKIVGFGKDAGYEYMYVTTNGVLATPKRMRDLTNNGLHSIRFSINAGNPVAYKAIHGRDCFERVLYNLMNCIKLSAKHKQVGGTFTKVMVSSVVTQEAKEGILMLKNRLEQLVDDFILITEITEQGAFRMDYKEECNFLFNVLKISSSGLAIPCCGCGHAMLAVADLNKEQIAAAWNNETARRMRRRFLNGDVAGTLCGVCLNRDEGSTVQPLLEGVI